MKDRFVGKKVAVILISCLMSITLVNGCGRSESVRITSSKKLDMELQDIQIIYFTQEIDKSIPNTDANALDIQNEYESYTDSGVLFLPASYSDNGDKTRLVITCHGSGTVIDENFDLNSKNYVETLVKSGYAVIDVNGGVEDGRHFGAPFAIQSYVKAYHWAVSNYNLNEEVFVFGASMGGLTSFTLAQSGAVPVVAQAAFCPVVDLLRQAWMYPWFSEDGDYSVQRERIAEYYEFSNFNTFESGTEQLATDEDMKYFVDNIDKVYGYYPMTNKCINYDQIISTDTTDFSEAYSGLIKMHNVPVKIWHAEDDKMVNPEFSEYIVNAIKNSGGIAYYRPFLTGGHTPNLGNEVTMYDENHKPFQTYVSEYELVQWFDRWN